MDSLEQGFRFVYLLWSNANELTWLLYKAGIVSSCVPTKRHPVVRKKAQMPLSYIFLKAMYTCMKFGVQGLNARYGHCPWWKRDL